MEKERNWRLLGIVAICIAVAGLSIAFASLSQTLNFTGTATVKGASWSVHFDDESLSTAAVTGGATVPAVDTITATTTEVSGYNITLPAPGAQVSYTIDIVNDGKLDAVIDTNGVSRLLAEAITGSGDSQANDEANVTNEIEISLTYAEATTAEQTGTIKAAGTQLQAGDLLLDGQTIKVRLTIGYDTDLSSSTSTLPVGDVVLTNFGYSVVYKQYVPAA